VRTAAHPHWNRCSILFAALAGFIRELIVEGTREGLAAARARGQRLGRPPVLTPEQVEHARYLLTRLQNTDDGPISQELVEVLADEVWERWEAGLAREGMTAIRQHAVDVRMGEYALERLGGYINKLAFEAAGGRWKKGRKGGRTPFEILADGLATGNADDLDLGPDELLQRRAQESRRRTTKRSQPRWKRASRSPSCRHAPGARSTPRRKTSSLPPSAVDRRPATRG
jgi:hypothetical protein